MTWLKGAVVLAVAAALAPIGAVRASAAVTGAPIKTDIDNGVFDWWAQPVAVNDGPDTWIGSIARAGTVRVAKVTAGTYQWATLAPKGEIAPDEHNTPALAFEDDKPYLIAFWTQHNADNIMRYRTIDRASLTVGPLHTLTWSATITYAQIIRNGTRLMVLTRVGLSTWSYRLSDDFGDTWTGERTLIDAAGYGQVYALTKPASDDGDLNHLAFYGHPVASTFRNVVYAQIRLGSGDVTLMDGTVLGNLNDPDGPAIRPDQMQPAITPSAGFKVRLLDVGTVNDEPAINYAVWATADGPATYKVKMRQADNTWATPPWAVPAGAPFGNTPAIHYVGGTSLGRDGLLYSVRNSGTVWIFEQWVWSETAATFVFADEIARDTTQELARPYVPLYEGAAQVTVNRFAKYATYTDYDSDVLVY
jgi:hypothetical protein